jgi:hypothetical protein
MLPFLTASELAVLLTAPWASMSGRACAGKKSSYGGDRVIAHRPPGSAPSFGMGLNLVHRSARVGAPVMLTGGRSGFDLFFLGVSVLRRGEEGRKPNAFYPS